MKYLLLAFLMVFCFLPVSVQAVNLIVNPGFEANSSGLPTSWGFTFTGTPVGSSSNSYIRNDSYSLNGNYFYLNDAPGPRPTLYQDLVIAAGSSYAISGNYRSMVIGSGSNSFAIQFTNLLNGTVLETVTYNPTGSSWSSFSFARTFATTSLRIAFISQYNTDDDYSIDNISFNGVAVPELSSLSLLLCGFLGVLSLRVRK